MLAMRLGFLFVLIICALAPWAAADTFPARRCVNLGNALDAPREGEWGYRIRSFHLQAIARAGFDSVRLPVRFSAWTEPKPPYRINEKLLRRVDEVIAQSRQNGLAVVLDVHHYYELHRDPDNHSARLAAIWRQLAERYRSQDDRLVFEILNEPEGAKMNAAAVERLHAASVAEIRKISPRRWVVLGGPDWSSVRGVRGWRPSIDARTALTVHYYDPYEFTHQNAPYMRKPPQFPRRWGEPADLARIRQDARFAAAWAQSLGAPLFLGEFGVVETAPLDERAAYVGAVREAFAAEGAGWCVWMFASNNPIWDVHRRRFIPELLEALIPRRRVAAAQ